MTNRRPRANFSKAVMSQAWDRAGGHCQKCTRALRPGQVHYDHVIPTAIKADNSLSNCQVLCTECHAGKTALDRKIIARAHRIEERRIGIKRKEPHPRFRKPEGWQYDWKRKRYVREESV